MLITAVTDLKQFQRFEQRPFVRERNISFSEERPLFETLEFLEISHGSYQPFNFLFNTVYAVLYSYIIDWG